MTDVPEFYFNIATHEVEEGKTSSWANRMGPYATREEAANALDLAARRSEAWDEEDEREEREDT